MEDSRALRNRKRFPTRHIRIEAAQSGQATVTCANAGLPIPFDMFQEIQYLGHREIFQPQFSDRPAMQDRRESQKKLPGIPIRTNGVRRKIALLNKPIVEEALNQRRKCDTGTHDGLPEMLSARCTYKRNRSLAC